MLRGPYPSPGVLNLGGFEVTRLRLQNRNALSQEIYNFFPTISSDDGHARNLAAVLL